MRGRFGFVGAASLGLSTLLAACARPPSTGFSVANARAHVQMLAGPSASAPSEPTRTAARASISSTSSSGPASRCTSRKRMRSGPSSARPCAGLERCRRPAGRLRGCDRAGLALRLDAGWAGRGRRRPGCRRVPGGRPCVRSRRLAPPHARRRTHRRGRGRPDGSRRARRRMPSVAAGPRLPQFRGGRNQRARAPCSKPAPATRGS